MTHWIQTFTGLAFDFAAPAPEQIAIEDIAHALSQQNRYTGHTSRPYSVAQHSLLVADLVTATAPDLGLTALLHDAAEAYLGDWSSPLKAYLRQHASAALDLERAIEAAIGARFGVDLVTRNPVIKAADLIALVTEKRDLFGPAPRAGWGDSTGYTMPGPDPEPIALRGAGWVEARFLEAFDRFGGVR